jgi:hypothetical protein
MFHDLSVLMSTLQSLGTTNLALLIVGLALLTVWKALGKRGK